MASGSYAGLIMSVVIILLALSANGHEGTIEWKWKIFGGRKMVQLIDKKSSHNSAKEKQQDAVKKFYTEPQQNSDGVNAKNKGEMSKHEGSYKRNTKSTRPVDSSNFQSFKSENMPAKHEHSSYDSSKAWLEAANVVANLMRQDYKGKGRPKRKPPINNHEPTN